MAIFHQSQGMFQRVSKRDFCISSRKLILCKKMMSPEDLYISEAMQQRLMLKGVSEVSAMHTRQSHLKSQSILVRIVHRAKHTQSQCLACTFNVLASRSLQHFIIRDLVMT